MKIGNLPDCFTYAYASRSDAKGGCIDQLRVSYRDGIALALFTSENTKGDLTEAADKWCATFGYLAEWRTRSIELGQIINWSEDLRRFQT